MEGFDRDSSDRHLDGEAFLRRLNNLHKQEKSENLFRKLFEKRAEIKFSKKISVNDACMVKHGNKMKTSVPATTKSVHPECLPLRGSPLPSGMLQWLLR